MTKTRRQTVILELLDHEQVTSQEILQRRLKTRGIHATQATISRDLKELGLVKRAGDGAYGRPGQDTTSPENALAHLSRAGGSAAPGAVQTRILYNPNLTTSWVMVPGIAGLILVFIGTLITSPVSYTHLTLPTILRV